MREKVDDHTYTLEEDLPEFSLDVNDLRELETIASTFSMKTSLVNATFKDVQITGPPSQVMEKFSPLTDKIALPAIQLRGEKEISSLLNQAWIFGESRTISVSTEKTKKEMVPVILRNLVGFFSLQSKKLGADEAAGYLYLRPKASVSTVKRPQPSPPDEARLISNTLESKLRKLIRDVPENEDEVQDAIENVLIVRGYEYHREIEHVPSGTKSTIPDFTLDAFEVAIEAKLCKHSEDERRILEEMNSDISSYQARYPRVVFVVYDVGIIRDVDRFAYDMRSKKDVYLTVIKH